MKSFLGTAISIDTSTNPWTFYYGPETSSIVTPGETITTEPTATQLQANAQTVNMIVIGGALVLLMAVGGKGNRG